MAGEWKQYKVSYGYCSNSSLLGLLKELMSWTKYAEILAISIEDTPWWSQTQIDLCDAYLSCIGKLGDVEVQGILASYP